MSDGSNDELPVPVTPAADVVSTRHGMFGNKLW